MSKKRRRKSNSMGRTVATVASVAVLALTAVTGAGAIIGKQAYHPNTAGALPSYSGRPTPQPTSTVHHTYTPVNILVMGTDTRSGKGLSKYGSTSLSSGYGHSDTVLFVHISADRKWAEAVSIPRDTTYAMPACAKTAQNGIPTVERFNWAYFGGGPLCTVRLAEQLTGMPIDHYVAVNFAGFAQVVDDLGGIPICTTINIHDVNAKLYLTKGNHVVNGQTALGLMRARETLGDGSDLSRITRQQIVLGAIVRKTVSKGTLSDPVKALNVLHAISSSIEVDPGLANLQDAVNFGLTMGGLRPSMVQFVRMPINLVPGQGTVTEAGLATVMWKSLAQDKSWPPLPKATPKPTTTTKGPALKTPPSHVQVVVYNGMGVTGAATKLGTQLHAVDGFQFLGAGDWKNSTETKTYVRYDPNWNESARTLSAALGGVPMVPVKNLKGTLQVVLGSDNPKVVKVTVAAPTSKPVTQPGITTAGKVRCIG